MHTLWIYVSGWETDGHESAQVSDSCQLAEYGITTMYVHVHDMQGVPYKAEEWCSAALLLSKSL